MVSQIYHSELQPNKVDTEVRKKAKIRNQYNHVPHLTQDTELDFFCSDIQLYVLLIPHLCFISFLYLDLYLLGDDISIYSLQPFDHLLGKG